MTDSLTNMPSADRGSQKEMTMETNNERFRWNGEANVWEFYEEAWGGWNILRQGPHVSTAPMTYEEGLSYTSTRSTTGATVAPSRTDTERLDWLEQKAKGYPIEVDAFTDAVFLTIHPAKDGMPLECEREGCHMNTNRIVQIESVRLGQGRSLRAAIDAAIASSIPMGDGGR